jgi:hypothetical protein
VFRILRGSKVAYLAGTMVLCLLASGCGKGLSKSNYEKIKTAMSAQEVEGILGQGTDLSAEALAKVPGMESFKKTPPEEKLAPGVPPMDPSSLRWVQWGDDQRYVIVGFAGDRVVIKQSKGL